ncbi:MAG TPA: multidrug effflux MFS transporter [Xanthobacteraceae bacterium]|nr:multidrug effflux MFS transporter [Xanthobacteraceae bacterium]
MADPARDGDTQDDVVPSGEHQWRLLALLIAITAVGPLSLNILAPAMPGLIGTLGAGAGTVQLTLSLFLLGMAVSQLVLGTLSDRFGRRPVMLAGLALTVVASFAALATTSIAGLIVARTAQAFGATAGIVIGRAVVRDLYDRDRAASMIGWVTMAMVVAPMIAPLIGGALDTALGWHAIFAFLGLFAAAVFVWALFELRETRTVATGEGFAHFLAASGSLLTDRAFLGYALVAAFNSAMFFTFIGGAPHVVVTIMHRSSAEYGVWFLVISLAYMFGNFAAGRWSAKFGVDFMVRAGVAVTVAGAAIGIVWMLIEPARGPEVIMVPQMIIGFASGFMLPSALAGAVSVRPQAAGAAAGITGFMQMGLGAATAQLIGHLLDGAPTGLPLAAIVLVLCACGLVAFFALARK